MNNSTSCKGIDIVNTARRRFLFSSVGACLAAPSIVNTALAGTQTSLGDSELYVVSDGSLSIPSQLVLPEASQQADVESYLSANSLNVPNFEAACNLTLWKSGERVVLFDVGAGPNFMPSAGKSVDDLFELGIDPEDVTDVVFTHAHPDHIWGLVDDFDELVFPNAQYYMHAAEWDYWWDENTVNTVPEHLQSMAVGARNRFVYLQDMINLFNYGEEVLPNIEAVDTHGHTPGHTSFALHQGNTSIMVLGDALTHPVISFEKAQWRWGTDQDQEAAKDTRLSLLDRLVSEKSQILGYHLPHPGIGMVERNGSAYRYVSQ